jgi:hypothetical protein
VISPDENAPEDALLALTLDGDAASESVLGTDAYVQGDDSVVSVDAGRVYELIAAGEFAVHHVSIHVLEAGVAFHLIEFGTIDVPEEA